MELYKEMKGTKVEYRKIIIYILTFFVIYMILISAITPEQYNVQVGDIATVDMKAPRDTVNERATKEKEKQIIESIDKQYVLKADVKINAENNINNLFDKISNVNSTGMEEKDKIISIKKVEGFTLSDDEIKLLVGLSNEDLAKIRWIALDTLNLVYENEIRENNTESNRYVREIADNEISKNALSNTVEELLKDIVYSQIKPNYFYDNDLTEEKKREALKSAPKVIIKKNETIVREGEAITEAHMEILEELGLLDKTAGKKYLYSYLVLGIYIIVILVLQFSYLQKEKKEMFSDNKMIVMISIINILPLAVARVLGGISPYLIPVACTSIIMTILINYKTSIIINMLNVLLLAVVVEFKPIILLLAIVNIIVSSITLNKVQQRNDILFTTLYTAIVSGVVTLATGMLISNNLKDIFLQTGYVAVGALLSGIFAIGLLPIFESAFDLVTNMKLLELSNPNHPLMKRLLMEAPGTYHHSMMVGNLAEVAAEEVGGNPVIARIGAYYHDIGKIKRPYFFGENQMGRENPHNNITANLSTLVIISHVKDGLELAKENKIPKIIQDMIEQHHGTTLVKYFYYTMKNSAENPDDIKEEEFKYPGPTPVTKEAGIIMLADSVEAAVRSINEPTKDKIRDMVNNIVKDKLHSGQLSNCDLTFRDIDAIVKCFLKVLNGIYHQRIEYPTDKKVKK